MRYIEQWENTTDSITLKNSLPHIAIAWFLTEKEKQLL
jgi:hypothetical protein